MDWTEALDLVIAQTRHEKYRALCADDHPMHDAWRRKMLDKAAGFAGAPRAYPPFFGQVATAVAAAGRVASAVVHGQPVVAPAEEQARRLSICGECEFYDGPQRRCRVCGCGGLKLVLETEVCPRGKW